MSSPRNDATGKVYRLTYEVTVPIWLSEEPQTSLPRAAGMLGRQLFYRDSDGREMVIGKVEEIRLRCIA